MGRQFRELSDADRLHQLGFEDPDDLDAAGEGIPEEWERATVTYPTGRRLTAMWPVGQIEKEIARSIPRRLGGNDISAPAERPEVNHPRWPGTRPVDRVRT